MKTDYISTIIRRYFANDYPLEMEERLQAWLLSEENIAANKKVAFDEKTVSDGKTSLKDRALFQIWDELEVTNDENVYRSLQMIKLKLGFRDMKNMQKSTSLSSNRKSPDKHKILFSVAAIFLLCLIGGWWYYFSIQTQWINITTSYGKSAQCLLPDSSKVWISPGSTFSYPTQFKGNSRMVRLSGEARLMVTKDSHKPFILQTSTCAIQVLGTVFQVSDYPEDQQATARLEEGKIQVSLPHGVKHLLVPNQKISIDKATHSISIASMEITDWEEGRLTFEDTPLHDIFQALKRHYGIPIFYRDFHPDNDRYSIKFDREDTLEQALDLLQALTENFIWSKHNNQIIIRSWHK